MQSPPDRTSINVVKTADRKEILLLEFITNWIRIEIITFRNSFYLRQDLSGQQSTAHLPSPPGRISVAEPGSM
jgi:hypothetical protein